MRWLTFFFVLCFGVFFVRSSMDAGGEKDKKEPDAKPYLLVVPPAGGKEVKLVDFRFTFGTRKLALDGAKTGPQYLEFREDKSTTYKNGIFTLIPLTSIRKITYDRDKKTVALVAVADDGKDVNLTGSTKFTTSNRLTIEAEALLDGLGAATVKFQGGIDKGLHSIAFPTPKPAPKVAGGASVVVADDKEKSKHTALDVQPLYQIDGGYRVMPYLMFKKTVKIDLSKIASLRFVPPTDKKKGSTDYEVTLKDGAKHTLTLLTSAEVDKKKALTLVGLLGRVNVGYKLFSLDAIYEYHAEKDEKK